MWINVVLIIGAYLLGSTPYMAIIARTKGLDPSQEKDLHDALWRKAGRLTGLSGVLVDILKGIIPIIIGFIFNFSLAITVAAGVAAIIGQMWPIFQKFDGERGNSTGLGMVTSASIVYNAHMILIIASIPALAGFLIRTVPRFMTHDQTLNERLMLGGPQSRSLPLGIIIGFAIAPLISLGFQYPLEMTLGLAAAFIAIVLRRLTADIRADLKTATDVKSILINRLLYDRSYL